MKNNGHDLIFHFFEYNNFTRHFTGLYHLLPVVLFKEKQAGQSFIGQTYFSDVARQPESLPERGWFL
jgi:hypothetical protein